MLHRLDCMQSLASIENSDLHWRMPVMCSLMQMQMCCSALVKTIMCCICTA